jgi:hypothetical protein
MADGGEDTEVEEPEFPWYRLPNETAAEYAKFSVYMNMAPGDRSYAEAERIYFNDDDKSGSQFNTLSKKHDWDERLEEFDQHTSEIAVREASLSHQREKERAARVTSSMLSEIEEFLQYFNELPKDQKMQKWMDMSPKEWAQTLERLEEIQSRALGDQREKEQDVTERFVSALESLDDEDDEKEVVPNGGFDE